MDDTHHHQLFASPDEITGAAFFERHLGRSVRSVHMERLTAGFAHSGSELHQIVVECAAAGSSASAGSAQHTIDEPTRGANAERASATTGDVGMDSDDERAAAGSTAAAGERIQAGGTGAERDASLVSDASPPARHNDDGPTHVRFILKRLNPQWDWLMQITEDTHCRSVALWSHGIFDRLPEQADTATVACARDGDGYAILMRDTAETLVTNRAFTMEQNHTFLKTLAAIHARFLEPAPARVATGRADGGAASQRAAGDDATASQRAAGDLAGATRSPASAPRDRRATGNATEDESRDQREARGDAASPRFTSPLANPELGLCHIDDVFRMFSPASAARFADLDRDIHRRITEGWARVAKVMPADVAEATVALVNDPTPLVAALAKYPHTLVHGDYRHSNLGWQPGRTILLDWQLATYGPPSIDIGRYIGANSPFLPEPKDQLIETYRRALAKAIERERRSVQAGTPAGVEATTAAGTPTDAASGTGGTAGTSTDAPPATGVAAVTTVRPLAEWWDAQLYLGLLGGFVQDGWAIALKATTWEIAADTREVWKADLEWWAEVVRRGLGCI